MLKGKGKASEICENMDLKNKILLVICLFTLFLPITIIWIVAIIAMGLEDFGNWVLKGTNEI